MTRVSSSLADLVEILNDGIGFYRDAANKVADPQLSEFFQKMSHLKKTIAADLNAEIANEGDEPREAGTWLGGMRKAYVDLLGRMGDQTVAKTIAELEEHEDRLMAAFRESALSDKSARVRELALAHFPEVEKMHAVMRQLKQQSESGMLGQAGGERSGSSRGQGFNPR